MPLYDVTFVMNAIVHRHIQADDEKALEKYIAENYGVGHEYYGPIAPELLGAFMQEIGSSGFYATGFVKKCAEHPDAVVDSGNDNTQEKDNEQQEK